MREAGNPLGRMYSGSVRSMWPHTPFPRGYSMILPDFIYNVSYIYTHEHFMNIRMDGDLLGINGGTTHQ